MEGSLTVSESELLELIAEMLSPINAPGLLTSGEIAEQIGQSRWKVLEMLRVLKGQGRLETGKKELQCLDDTCRRVPAYRLKPGRE